MNQRTDSVILQVGNNRQTFEVSHAERILRMPNNGGWHLPEDSEFEMTEENGIKLRTSKGQASKVKKEANDK